MRYSLGINLIVTRSQEVWGVGSVSGITVVRSAAKAGSVAEWPPGRCRGTGHYSRGDPEWRDNPESLRDESAEQRADGRAAEIEQRVDAADAPA